LDIVSILPVRLPAWGEQIENSTEYTVPLDCLLSDLLFVCLPLKYKKKTLGAMQEGKEIKEDRDALKMRGSALNERLVNDLCGSPHSSFGGFKGTVQRSP
jgi:hypothetical protein